MKRVIPLAWVLLSAGLTVMDAPVLGSDEATVRIEVPGQLPVFTVCMTLLLARCSDSSNVKIENNPVGSEQVGSVVQLMIPESSERVGSVSIVTRPVESWLKSARFRAFAPKFVPRKVNKLFCVPMQFADSELH